MKSISKIILTCLISILCLFQTGCRNSNINITETDFCMDTYVSITVYKNSQQNIAQKAIELCKEYENILSKTSADGDIKKLENNRFDYLKVSEHTINIIKLYKEFHKLSEGKLDCTVGKLTNLWNFKDINSKPPSESDISLAVDSIGMDYVDIKNNTVSILSEATSLDFGAIAKGYISERIKEFLIDNGVKNALLNFGGNVVTIGSKPDGSNYNIGIQDPDGTQNEAVTAVSVNDKAVITAGVYERAFEYNGTLYHHILDPNTGYSALSDLISATIICDDATLGDAYSTTCILLGKEKALKLINETENIEAILITSDNEIITSENASLYIKE